MALVEPKPERPHEPELRSGCHARPSDVPRILWNVGLVEDDVEEGRGEGRHAGREGSRIEDRGWRMEDGEGDGIEERECYPRAEMARGARDAAMGAI